MPTDKRSRAARARAAATGEPYTLALRRVTEPDGSDPFANFDADEHDRWLVENLAGVVFHVGSIDWALTWSFAEGEGPELASIFEDLAAAECPELRVRCGTLDGMADELAERLAATLEADSAAQRLMLEHAVCGSSDPGAFGAGFVAFLTGDGDAPPDILLAVELGAFALRGGQHREQLADALATYLADPTNAHRTLPAAIAMKFRHRRLPAATAPIVETIARAVIVEPSAQLLTVLHEVAGGPLLEIEDAARTVLPAWTRVDTSALRRVLAEIDEEGYDIEDILDAAAPLLAA